ncbi:hypothetical protein TUBRATIS_10650 [Tubulinosema ratisbonensis]|uniref:Uncharacterized protein n=1 Tax=Tubulinosema ratisbonensis TaxID=291195 RepID=A0A437AMZ1_9MICR|nr:hypothetical protein TUBRATIS_10650 [Tubulinosema ratisbonensis]
MKTLEELLLGEALTKQSDKATFPSSPFKKALCLGNHCTQSCQKSKKILEYVFERKFSPEFLPLPLESKIQMYLLNASSHIILKNEVKKDENDKKLFDSVFEKCAKNAKEREVFLIVKNLQLYFQFDCINLVIYFINLPNSTKENVYKILYHLFVTLEYKDCQDKLKEVDNLPDWLDVILLCNVKSNIFVKYTDISDLKEYACNHMLEIEKVPEVKDVDYFDCLVLQNEILKSFEKKKEDYEEKIKILEKMNEELIMSNINLKENIASLEKSLSDFEKKYVNELKNMIREKDYQK